MIAGSMIKWSIYGKVSDNDSCKLQICMAFLDNVKSRILEYNEEHHILAHHFFGG